MDFMASATLTLDEHLIGNSLFLGDNRNYVKSSNRKRQFILAGYAASRLLV